MSSLYDRTNVRKIVVHHLGNGLGPLTNPDQLREQANPHGYTYPEYDYGILVGGERVLLRPLEFIGAHCIADKPYYSSFTKNWWNENSASVVIACDCVKYTPTVLQVSGLIKFLTSWLGSRGLTMDDCYPHFQLSSTLCPGAKYKKLELNTGNLDYDYIEQTVNHNLTGGLNMNLIVSYSKADLPAAWMLAEAVGGGIVLAEHFPLLDAAKIGNLFQVGGPALYPGKAILLSGVNRYDTARKVLNYIEEGGLK